jgi:hypothetical protein
MRGLNDFGLVTIMHEPASRSEALCSETFIVIPPTARGTWMLTSISETRHVYDVQSSGCSALNFQAFSDGTYEIVIAFTIDFSKTEGFVSLAIEGLDSVARVQWFEGIDSLVISDFAGYRLTLTDPMVELPTPSEVVSMDMILKRQARK